jgi:hypothetical protein
MASARQRATGEPNAMPERARPPPGRNQKTDDGDHETTRDREEEDPSHPLTRATGPTPVGKSTAF